MYPSSSLTDGPFTWYIGRFFGSSVYIQPLFLLLVGYIAYTWGNGLLTTALLIVPFVFLAILGHELGHAITTKLFGYGNSTIVLHGIGGVAINESGRQQVAWKSAVISFAGPMANFIMAALGFAASIFITGPLPVLAIPLGVFIYFNIILGIFNLLPIHPLDGGHILNNLLIHFKKPPRKAITLTAKVSIVFLVALVLISIIYMGFSFFTLFIAFLLFQSNLMILRQNG